MRLVEPGRWVSRFATILDACVQVPVALTDTLLRLAEYELYRPLWSARVLEKRNGR